MYRKGSTLLLKSTSDLTSRLRLRPTRELSTPIKVDPTLLPKFKCHSTIPCGIPRFLEDLNKIWYHVADDLLPTNWSSNWPGFRGHAFLPDMSLTYSMGEMDIVLSICYRIPYPIKGVMYCIVARVEPGGLFKQQLPRGNPEGFVFQDAIGDYYFFYEFSQGGDEYLAKFRAPRGTTVNDFVKHHFRGAVKDVDMDLVLPDESRDMDCHKLWKEQNNLAALQRQASAESRCACRDIRGN